MEAEDLHCLYRQLRIELEAACAKQPPDDARIRQILSDMKPLEAELAGQGTSTLDRFVSRDDSEDDKDASTG